MRGMMGALAGVLFLSGCGLYAEKKIYDYRNAASSIQLGQSQSAVLAKLEPIRRSTPSAYVREPDTFIGQNGKTVLVYYIVSDRISDGIQTDDEYTPYIFVDGRLVAIGWAALGGPKTAAQPRSAASAQASNAWLIQQGQQLMNSSRTAPPPPVNCTTIRQGAFLNTTCR